MYVLIDEAESRRYRNECSDVMTKACAALREKGINAQFVLVGSGARNLVTRNGNSPYDLDYNLEIVSADNEYRKDLRSLKDTVRNALNKANGFDFSDAHDSTSVLTCLLHFDDTPNLKFSFDVAIVAKNPDGTMCRLIHNKNAWRLMRDQYTWNEVPSSHMSHPKRPQSKKPICGLNSARVMLTKRTSILNAEIVITLHSSCMSKRSMKSIAGYRRKSRQRNPKKRLFPQRQPKCPRNPNSTVQFRKHSAKQNAIPTIPFALLLLSPVKIMMGRKTRKRFKMNCAKNSVPMLETIFTRESHLSSHDNNNYIRLPSG